ncbi:hypothetical protein FACS1894133_2080 [Clostridia bacterium]|nr:hypothetical protein FACS1894133_2080 [Clostridia bacterium]
MRFAQELEDNPLAKGLALRYSEVFTMGRFRTLSVDDDDFFKGKSEAEIKEIGRLEGKLEGELKANVCVVKNMYKAGADVNTIQKFTGFDTSFIQSVSV